MKLFIFLTFIAFTLANPVQKNVIGVTNVRLESETCSKEECNLGNLIADSFRYSFLVESGGALSHPIILQVGNQIKASLDQGSQITDDIVKSILPNNEKLFARKVKGNAVRAAFEHSVRK